MNWASVIIIFATASLPGAVLAIEQDTPPFSIRYDKSLLDANINNAALGEVLRELEMRTGTHVILSDPATGGQRVSAVVKAMPFEPGVRHILDGFSYAMYPVAGASLPSVIVLSTPVVPREADHTGVTTEFADASVLQSLNEDARQATLALAAEWEQQDIILQRAVMALNSGDRPLHGEAIYTLIHSDDPRAIEALVETVLHSETMDTPSRARAVQELWQYAAAQAFANEAAVNALEQFAREGNGHVSRIAKRALREVQQFQEAKSGIL